MKGLLQLLLLTVSVSVGALNAYQRSSSIIVFEGDTKIAVVNQDSDTISIVDLKKTPIKIT